MALLAHQQFQHMTASCVWAVMQIGVRQRESWPTLMAQGDVLHPWRLGKVRIYHRAILVIADKCGHLLSGPSSKVHTALSLSL